MLTSIWNLKQCVVQLYFYHDYDHKVNIDLHEELAKGNHFIILTSLFPTNSEYKKFLAFKTPINSAGMDLFLRFCVLLFFLSGILLIIFSFRKRNSKHAMLLRLLALLNFTLLFYMFVLAQQHGIYYFPAPYRGPHFTIVDVTSYIPFLVLLIIIPLLIWNRKIFKEKSLSSFVTTVVTLNNLIYVTLIGLFAYWGLYNVFS